MNQQKLIIAISVPAVVFAILFDIFPYIRECSDTGGYLAHPGSEMSPSALLSGAPYIFIGLFNSNYLWILFIQSLSTSLYLLVVLMRYRDRSLFQLIGLLALPWMFSLLSHHYWLCGIRNGLSMSFLLAYVEYFYDKKITRIRDRILSILLVFASIIAHWSSAFIFVLLMLPEYLYGKEFRKSYLNKFLMPLLVPLGLYFIVSFIDIFSKYQSLYEFDVGNEYGRIFPVISLLWSVYTLFFCRPAHITIINRYTYLTTMLLFLILLSGLPLVGFSKLFMRTVVSLQIVVSYMYISDWLRFNIRNLASLFILALPILLFTIPKILSSRYIYAY